MDIRLFCQNLHGAFCFFRALIFTDFHCKTQLIKFLLVGRKIFCPHAQDS